MGALLIIIIGLLGLFLCVGAKGGKYSTRQQSVFGILTLVAGLWAYWLGTMYLPPKSGMPLFESLFVVTIGLWFVSGSLCEPRFKGLTRTALYIVYVASAFYLGAY